MAPSAVTFYNMSFYLSAYKAVEPINYAEKLSAPVSPNNFGAPQFPAPIPSAILGEPEPIKDDGGVSGHRIPHQSLYGPLDPINPNEDPPEAPAAYLLEQRIVNMYCAKPCMHCTDPKGADWKHERDWFFIYNDDGQYRKAYGRWISKRYTAGTRYYFATTRNTYEEGLQFCNDKDFVYVLAALGDGLWHPFAIDNPHGHEQLMPGCSVYYPSRILSCSNELGGGL